MKRALAVNSEDSPVAADGGTKRRKPQEGTPFANLDDDMLFEVLKHADARTLAAAACVSRRWRSTAEDERLWEMICTRHWANVDCGSQQLRSVVLALGGFRRLHALCLWPLLKRPSCLYTTSSSGSSLSSSPYPPPVVSSKGTRPHWGKDEVNLSLSLLSIRYYEKMNFNSRVSSNLPLLFSSHCRDLAESKLNSRCSNVSGFALFLRDWALFGYFKWINAMARCLKEVCKF